jgi:phenylacetate-CoA ligase
MLDWQEEVYRRLPVPLQHLALSYKGASERRLRYGGEFRTFLEWLRDSQWWSAKEIELYQQGQLRALVAHAYETVPYYQTVFDERNLKPSDVQSIDDLQKLPILTKEDVRNHLDELVSRAFPRRKLVKLRTSGTTGKSLHFYAERRAFRMRWAVFWRFRERFGIRFDAPFASFTGRTVVPLDQQRPPFWREDLPLHHTMIPSHHLTPAKIEAIAERLNNGGFEYYVGHSSILYRLVNLLDEAGLEITARPKIAFATSENLHEHHRSAISRVLGCQVTSLYGFNEGCGSASSCKAGVFHEDFEYGILECVDPSCAADDEVRGRIVATGLAGYGMPFIRYDIGDIGVWKKAACSCGRHSTVLARIDGREHDCVITPEGGKVMWVTYYIMQPTPNVKEAQVVQRELGSICVRIVRRPTYSAADERLIRYAIATRISPSLDVHFEYVSEIEREPGGKFRAVKCLLGNCTSDGRDVL